MLRILESEFIGHFTHRLTKIEYLFFCYLNHLFLDIVLCGFTSIFFDKISKIIRRLFMADLFGKDSDTIGLHYMQAKATGIIDLGENSNNNNSHHGGWYAYFFI